MDSARLTAVVGIIVTILMLTTNVQFYRFLGPSVPPYKRIRSHLEEVTHPNNTMVAVLNRERVYHQGDVLTAVIVARDIMGRPKTYGGDFFRAKIVSSRSGEASSAGHVIDHRNGTYTVQFTLHWTGGVWVSIQLVHPSDAVKVLQRLLNVPNVKVFFCSFFDAKRNTEETRQCFSSEPTSLPQDRRCDLSNRKANGSWFCERPATLPCSSISTCRIYPDKTEDKFLGLVSEEEKRLFRSPYLEKELEQDIPRPIHVRESTSRRLPKCSANTPDVLSHGYWSGKVWKSSLCRVRVFTGQDVGRCLAGKTVYIQGDSTVRQWFLRLAELIPLEKHGDFTLGPATGKHGKLKIDVRYRFHAYPIRMGGDLSLSQIRYVVDELDALHGGPDTVVVLSLWAHFTQEPLELFRARLYAIRRAIRRLLHQSPGTRVFVRTGTTREHKGSKLFYYLMASDWYAYRVTQEIRRMFRAEKDVVVLDTWDMSVCQWEPDNLHPGPDMIDSQLNMLLSHICPE